MLVADGIVGPADLGEARRRRRDRIRRCSEGTEGVAVRGLQRRLIDAGFGVDEIDGQLRPRRPRRPCRAYQERSRARRRRDRRAEDVGQAAGSRGRVRLDGRAMGREAASLIVLALSEPDAAAVAQRLHARRRRGAGARRRGARRLPPARPVPLLDRPAGPSRAEPRFEIRIALTNDTWALRAPLERALTPIAAGARRPPALRRRRAARSRSRRRRLVAARSRTTTARRRDAFIARVGDFTAPLSADHVYLYIHQTRWNQRQRRRARVAPRARDRAAAGGLG